MAQILNTPYMMVLFLVILFIVAFLYSSVGHGGASGYLAVLALFGADPAYMKSSALMLNIFVSLIAFSTYAGSGYFNWKLFLPFALASIPASFIGATISLDASIYKKILGVSLLFPILKLSGIIGTEPDSMEPINWKYGLFIGSIIGLFSGMVGIGGGIILSPIILLFHWAKMKETAAVSALFIFVNSISGLAGILTKGVSFDPSIYLLLLIALEGGFIGSYLGARKFNNKKLSYILAIVLFIASIKLIIT